MQDNKGEGKQGGLSWSTPAAGPTPVHSPVPAQKQFVAPKAPPLTQASMQSNTTKYAGMIVLGIIAGVVIAWGWAAMRAPKEASVTPTDIGSGIVASATSTLSVGSSLIVASPQAAGNSVMVAKAVVSSPTWIVIYEDNGGKAGNALGAGLFFPGNQGGTVELLRGTIAGKSYLATEQVDNGDRKFSLKDDQFLSVDGMPQWISFEVK